MKNYLVLLLAILGSLAGFSQTHFTDAHAGTNAEAYMTIYVFSGQIGGADLQSGDEIALFDGSICVGTKVLTGPLASTVSVKAAKKDAGLSNGYVSGHAIIVKMWDSSTSKEYLATVVYHADSPFSVYTDNESAYMDISAKETITINLTAQNKEYDGSDNAVVSYSVSGGTVSGDVTITASNGMFDTKDAGTGKPVTGILTVSGVDAGNYDFTKVETTTANITALPITITADAKSKTYGDPDPVFTAQVTSGSIIPGDAASGALTRVAGTSVNTYAINQGTYTYGSNYAETFVSADLAITVKALSIKPNAKSKSYGATDPAFTYVSTPGLVSGDALTGALSRDPGESIDFYNYTLGSLSGGSNYLLSLDPASPDFEITPKALTLSGLTVASKVYDGTKNATLTGTATLSGVVGAESVTLGGTPVGTFLTANAGNGITVNISGMSISGADAGNYTLNASLSGNITPKALSVTGAVAQDKVYDGTTSATISGASLSGIVGSDDVALISSTVGAFAHKEVGTDIAVSASSMSLGGIAAGNYTLTAPTGLKADITKKELTVTSKDRSKCVGSSIGLLATDFIADGLADGDAITGIAQVSDGSGVGAEVGTYDIIPSGAVGAGLENYTMVYANGKLTVEALPTPAISGSVQVTQVPIQVIYTTEAGMTDYTWSVTSGGTIVSGAGTNQITVDWTSIPDQSITVAYTNASGCSGTYSQSITSFSLPTAVISGSTELCPGLGATLSVALTGAAPWSIIYSNGSISKTITGISESLYTFSVTPSAGVTTTYTITSVTDANNMTNSGTGNAVVTALPNYVAPTVPAINDLCYGANDAVIRATVPGTQSGVVEYQWQSSPDNMTWIDVDNSNTLNYMPGALYNSIYYRVFAFIPGCESKVSNAIKVNVHEPITNAVVSCEKQTLCFGDVPAKLTSTPSSGGNGTFNYQWQMKTSGNWLNVGANSLSYQPESITITTTFRLITRDTGAPSCGSVYSNELVVFVMDPILPGTISGDQKIADGGVPAPLTSLTPGSGSGTISYEWESSVDNGVTWTLMSGASDAGYSPGALTVPTWFRRITVTTHNSVSCTAASDPVKITFWTTGINNPEGQAGGLIAYAVRNIEIRIKGKVNMGAIATLYDMQGRAVKVKNLEEGSLNIMQTTGIKSAIYLLSVIDNGVRHSFKIPLNE